jgi:ligand-binding sensor domain-containing protein
MKYRLALLMACCSTILVGQQYHFTPQPFFPESDVRSVNLIYQTADDLIWLGTNNGLFSFDGRVYVHRPRSDHKAIKPTALAQDQNGALWIGYEDGYVEVRTGLKDMPTLPADSLLGFAVTGIVFNHDSDIFIATYGKGLWAFKEGKWSRVRSGDLAQIQDIYDVVIDHQGDVWLATDEGIWIYRPGTGSSLQHIGRDDGLPDEIVTQLHSDGANGIWAGSYDAGMAHLRLAGQAITVETSIGPHIKDDIVFTVDHNGALWVGGDKLIVRYNADGSTQNIMLSTEIEDRLSALFIDRTGNLWLAAGNKLLIADPEFSYYKPPVKGIQTIAMTDDRIWLGCETGLYAMDLHTQKVERHLQNQDINVISLFADPAGLIWIGTFGQGLYCLDPGTRRHKHWDESDGLTNGSILNIDGFGKTIFVATLGGISSIRWSDDPIQGPVTITDFFKQFDFPPGYVYDVFVDADRQVWFGTDGKGLFKWSDNTFAPFALPDFQKDDEAVSLKTIYSITQDLDKNMWVSGENGLVISFKPSGELGKVYRNEKGMVNTLALSSADEIMKINDGSIRLIRKNGMNEYLDQHAGFEHFSPSINSVCKGPDGSVWIGDVETVWRYAPAARDSHYHVHLHIEHIYPTVLNKLSETSLQPDSNFLDVRFSGLWFKDPSRVRYRYKLEGHDPDWIYTREGLKAPFRMIFPYPKGLPGNLPWCPRYTSVGGLFWDGCYLPLWAL